MKGKVFQFVVVIHPTDKEAEEGGSSKVIVPVTAVIANDQNSATLQAGRAIPEEYLSKLDRIEVAVRPF
uniref:Uncharacterized protein n=1 Tax=viral metagenome TaxID=1070528 RepID=A0A6H1Z9B2_9ZZZZ